MENQICSTCKVGKESYKLDSRSELCPYISCWQDGECKMYEPDEKDAEENLIS